jgi:hypothetical protein
MTLISLSSATSALLAFALLGVSESSIARADDDIARPPAAADNPVEENYRINEARRQYLIARQLDLNYRMIFSAGYGPRYPNPFEPWPRVPGDIWGYPMPRPIEHPIGQESVQTGPNTWTSRPLYAAAVKPPAKTAGAAAIVPGSRPAQAKVQLPGPSDRDDPITPNPRLAPPRRAASPREF